jgi:hypothetical protein
MGLHPVELLRKINDAYVRVAAVLVDYDGTHSNAFLRLTK